MSPMVGAFLVLIVLCVLAIIQDRRRRGVKEWWQL